MLIKYKSSVNFFLVSSQLIFFGVLLVRRKHQILFSVFYWSDENIKYFFRKFSLVSVDDHFSRYFLYVRRNLFSCPHCTRYLWGQSESGICRTQHHCYRDRQLDICRLQSPALVKLTWQIYTFHSAKKLQRQTPTVTGS